MQNSDLNNTTSISSSAELEKEVELYNCGLSLRLSEFNLAETRTSKKQVQEKIQRLNDELLRKEKQAVAAMAAGANSLYDDISVLIQRNQQRLKTQRCVQRELEEKERGLVLLIEHTQQRLRRCQQVLIELSTPVKKQQPFAQMVAESFRKNADGKFVKTIKDNWNNVIELKPLFGPSVLPVPH